MKTVLITGSARGIGAATAALFADSGYNVVINYNTSEAEALSLCEKLRTQGANAIAVKADVSHRDKAEILFDEANKAFGGVDVLVNNAGIAQQYIFHYSRMHPELFDK